MSLSFSNPKGGSKISGNLLKMANQWNKLAIDIDIGCRMEMTCQVVLYKQTLVYAWGDQAQALACLHVKICTQQI